MTVAFYISGHGFGHASRSVAVANAVASTGRAVIRSAAPEWLLKRNISERVEVWPVETDTGVAQIDSLRLDATETIRRAEAFMATFDARVAEEVRFLRAHDAKAVVADIPPLGIAAARAAGLPAFALGNFTWDWIYDGYPGGAAIAQRIGEIYSQTTLALRLPMWGGFETMPRVRDIPFVARRSSWRTDESSIQNLRWWKFGIPPGARAVLVSFGGYGLTGARKPIVPGYHILWPGDIDERAMYESRLSYQDLVRAVDVVVTKPGYGIISECIANDTAILYTSRGDFREYPVLVEAMPKYVRCAFIDHADLFSGHWAPHLDRLLAQPAPPERPAINGAAVAAEIIRGELRTKN